MLNAALGWTPGQLGLVRTLLGFAGLLALCDTGLFVPTHEATAWLGATREALPLDLLHGLSGALGLFAVAGLVFGRFERAAAFLLLVCLLGRLLLPPHLGAAWMLLAGPLVLQAARQSVGPAAENPAVDAAWLRLARFQWAFLLPIAAVLLLDRPGGPSGLALAREIETGPLGAWLPAPSGGLAGALPTWLLLAPFLLTPLVAFERMARPLWLAQLLGLLLGALLLGELSLLLGPLLVLLYAFLPRWLPPDRSAVSPVVFYDGTCGLCHASVRFALAESPGDAALRFAPLGGQTAGGREGLDAGQPSLVFTAEGTPALRESRAVLALLRRLGGLWRVLARLLSLIPAPVRDLGYRGVAALRGRLRPAPRDACPVLPEAQRVRVLP